MKRKACSDTYHTFIKNYIVLHTLNLIYIIAIDNLDFFISHYLRMIKYLHCHTVSIIILIITAYLIYITYYKYCITFMYQLNVESYLYHLDIVTVTL